MREEAQNIQNRIQEILDSDRELRQSPLSTHELTQLWLLHNHIENLDQINQESLLALTRDFQEIKTQIESVTQSDKNYHNYCGTSDELTLTLFSRKENRSQRTINQESLRILYIECQIQNILESDRDLKQLLPSSYELTQLWFSHKNLGYPDKIDKSILLIFVISLLDNDNASNRNLRTLLPTLTPNKPGLYSKPSYDLKKASFKKALIEIYNRIDERPNTKAANNVRIFIFGAISLFESYIKHLKPLNYPSSLILLKKAMLCACTTGQIDLIKQLSSYIQRHESTKQIYQSTPELSQEFFTCRHFSFSTDIQTNIQWLTISDTLTQESIFLATRFGGIDALIALIDAMKIITDDETAYKLVRSGFIELDDTTPSQLLLSLAQNGQIKELQFCIDYIKKNYPDDFPKAVRLISGEYRRSRRIAESRFNYESSAYLQALFCGHLETAKYLYTLIIGSQLYSGEIFTDGMLYTKYFSNLNLTKKMLIKAVEFRSIELYKYIIHNTLQTISNNTKNQSHDYGVTSLPFNLGSILDHPLPKSDINGENGILKYILKEVVPKILDHRDEQSHQLYLRYIIDLLFKININNDRDNDINTETYDYSEDLKIIYEGILFFYGNNIETFIPNLAKIFIVTMKVKASACMNGRRWNEKPILFKFIDFIPEENLELFQNALEREGNIPDRIMNKLEDRISKIENLTHRFG